jgi:nitroreductase/NAD-dependent dihydropyrimidine dehydrogenase PreA subunit
MDSHQVTIASDKCKKDGLCVKVCPARIFSATEHEIPKVAHVELCVLCGQCLAVCPSGAVSHSRLSLDRFRKIEERAPVSYDSLVDLIQQRRSVRVYKRDPVPHEVLEKLANLAGYAPTSAHGKEGWVRSVTVVSGEQNMRELVELSLEYLRELRTMLGSSLVKVVSRFKIEPRRGMSMVEDLSMRIHECEQGRDALTYQAPAAMFVHTPAMTHEPSADCDSALYAMMLAAQAEGLGTCWNGYIAKAAEAFKAKKATRLRTFLRIPDHHLVVAALTIGYPAVKLHSVPQRETKVTFIE